MIATKTHATNTLKFPRVYNDDKGENKGNFVTVIKFHLKGTNKL